ncbi:MAG: hypothetical protein HYV33_06470 [Candidatus Kerfeldbacteria bacterium]|nr:hypothetical protein [Candidatus Kerfeldbacteria bacterium]
MWQTVASEATGINNEYMRQALVDGFDGQSGHLDQLRARQHKVTQTLAAVAALDSDGSLMQIVQQAGTQEQTKAASFFKTGVQFGSVADQKLWLEQLNRSKG